MTTMTDPTLATTRVNSVYIRATPQAIWDAVTTPEWTNRYGYGGYVEFDGLEPGAPFRVHASQEFLDSGAPDVIIDGEVLEADPPRRLVQTWRMLMDEGLKAEGFTRLTYEISDAGDQGTKLTIVHELDGAPGLHALVGGEMEHTGAGGGWAWVLSDLKSLLETGTRLSE